MKKEEVLDELKKVIFKDREIYYNMMAIKAYHQLGDLSSDKYELCHVSNETNDFYVGSWVEGMGFFNVLFPKNSTRDLTQDEINKFDNLGMEISGNPIGRMKIIQRLNNLNNKKQ